MDRICLICFSSVVCKMFPLLVVTGHSEGGYNLDTNEIGLVAMCCGSLQRGRCVPISL